MSQKRTFYAEVTLILLTLFFALTDLFAEPIRLKSGREIQMIDGKIPQKSAEDLYQEAEKLFKEGRLDLAREYWQLLVDKAKGGPATGARTAQEQAKKVEYGSLVILRDDRILTGRVRAQLRMDLLGLEGKDEIPIWQIEEIIAEYHIGLSRVSKTYYPLTVLEIKLRNQKVQTARITREIEFFIEAADGVVTKVFLGKDYEILRPNDLDKQVEELTRGRITKVVIFPQLKRSQ